MNINDKRNTLLYFRLDVSDLHLNTELQNANYTFKKISFTKIVLVEHCIEFAYAYYSSIVWIIHKTKKGLIEFQVFGSLHNRSNPLISFQTNTDSRFVLTITKKTNFNTKL